MPLVETEVQDNLAAFFNFIYAQEVGFAYVALKAVNGNVGFTQRFFQWPEQKDLLVQHVVDSKENYEVFYGPALYDSAAASKSAVKSSSVVWVEFDGEVPDSLPVGIPEPSMRIRSSTEDHEHWYWKLEESIAADVLERINRSLTYSLGADSSGWDATQILRPPLTKNHKRGMEVELLVVSDFIVNFNVFASLSDVPPRIEIPVPEAIPQLEHVIAKYAIPAKTYGLFLNGTPEGKRSDGLMRLAYDCAEIGMTNPEILAILVNADARWGKFAERNDKFQRLMDIVQRAKIKYPAVEINEVDRFRAWGYKELLDSDIKLEWVWDGLLQKQGYFLLSGPSGVGKTQFSLSAMSHFALGRSYLEREVQPQRIGFFSLEMAHADLKHFLLTCRKNWTDEELQILDKNLVFFPLGEPLYLSNTAERNAIVDTIRDLRLDGVVFDSLGSTTDESISNEEVAKRLMDWNDKLRARLGIFTWFIHHHRKANSDNKRPNKLADVYGNQYLTARATSVMCLWETGIQSTVEAIPLKVRLSPKPAPFAIYRGQHLNFSASKGSLAIIESDEIGTELGSSAPAGGTFSP